MQRNVSELNQLIQEIINLQGKNICDRGPALASDLKKDKALTTITLDCNNEIAADCARALASALEKNHTLTNTTFADKIDHELKKRICFHAAENADKQLQKNLTETKSAIQNAKDIDNKTKDGLQNIEDLKKSSTTKTED